MKLATAYLCADCDEVFVLGRPGLSVERADPRAPLGNGSAHEQTACPSCGSRTFWPLARFVSAPDGKVRRKLESEECMWRDNVIEDLVDLLRGLFPTQAVISEDDLDDIRKAVESYLRTVQTEPRR